MKKRTFFLICSLVVMMGLMRCQNRAVEYEDFLQTFFEVTTPDTTLVKKLMGKTKGHVYTFLHGLYYREEYRINRSATAFAKAEIIFDKLIEEAPGEYYGYAGKGLMATERGMLHEKPSEDLLRQHNFDLALKFFKQAVKRKPDLAMLYFYMGKNEFYRYHTDKHSTEINLNTVYYLDTAMRKRPGFYKAYLRSAQYLSVYTIIARSNDINRPEAEVSTQGNDSIVYTTTELSKKVPMVHERIKYLFSECLKLKSRRPSEVYISMANASLTYFEFSRIGFLDSATKLLGRDTTELEKIRQKKSEIYYHDLKLYKTALANYNKWLRPQDEPRHWVAKAWCLFQDEATRRDAFSELQEGIKTDNTHTEQYLFTLGMMDTQIHNYQSALSELFLARDILRKQKKPDGYIVIEIIKVHLALNDRKRATEELRKLTTYEEPDDPFNDEIKWSVTRLVEFYKLAI